MQGANLRYGPWLGINLILFASWNLTRLFDGTVSDSLPVGGSSSTATTCNVNIRAKESEGELREPETKKERNKDNAEPKQPTQPCNPAPFLASVPSAQEDANVPRHTHTRTSGHCNKRTRSAAVDFAAALPGVSSRLGSLLLTCTCRRHRKIVLLNGILRKIEAVVGHCNPERKPTRCQEARTSPHKARAKSKSDRRSSQMAPESINHMQETAHTEGKPSLR